MQDFGQPLVDPWPDPFEDRLGQPLEETLTGLEYSIEQSLERDGVIFYPKPDSFMDGLGRLMGAVEASIEGMEIRPLKIEEPEPTVPLEPLVQQPVSEGPPPPPERTKPYWISLRPPLAALPYLSPDGIVTSSAWPRAGMGAGIRNTSPGQAYEVYCPLEQDLIPSWTCEQKDCEYLAGSDSEQWCDYQE